MKSKKEITFANGESCCNCGTPLDDRYCPHCGQDRLKGLQRSFGRMAMDIGSSIFAFDDKSWSTFRKLVFRPGYLSKEYIEGRLIRYTTPFKIFWMVVLVFTIVYSFHNDASLIFTSNDGTEEAPQNVISDFLKYLPYFMLLTIPFFTALLKLFFRKEKYAFSEHLIFAVHLHSVIFFLLTLGILVSAYLFDSEWLLFPIICLYSILAFFSFYNKRRKISILWRMLLIGLLYLIILFVLIVLILMFFSYIFDMSSISFSI
jgi:hypothetical protein